MMRFSLLAALILVMCLAHHGPAQAQAVEFALVDCLNESDLAACDEFVAKTDDHNKKLKAQAYAVRAIVRISLDDINGATSDFAKIQTLDSQNDSLADIREMLDDRLEPQQELKRVCLAEFDPAATRIDACTGLINGGGGTARQQLDYHAARGRAYFSAGNFAAAQADIRTALQGNPHNVVYITDSIVFLYGAGDYEAALAATQDALARQPKPTMEYALFQGQLNYLLGHHVMAIQKLLAARHVDARYAEGAYWVSLLREEDRDDVARDFHLMVDQLGPQDYTAKIARFHLGTMTAQALVAAANGGPQVSRQKRLCKAYFNIGHQAWLAGDIVGAKQAFQTALATNQYRLIEYQASKVLLKKLGQQ